jgi:hypothetical protein
MVRTAVKGFKGRRDPEPFERDIERIEMIHDTKVYSILRQIIETWLVVDVPKQFGERRSPQGGG